MRRLSQFFLVIVVGSGILIGIIFIVLSQILSRLEEEKFAVEKRLANSAVKESTYLAIKGRVGHLGSLLSHQYDWGAVLQFVSSVIPKDSWTKFVSAQDQKVTLTFKTDSITTARELVDSLAEAARSQVKIRRPELINVFIPPLGGIEVSISFIPILSANL